jgi:hypothetical protein
VSPVAAERLQEPEATLRHRDADRAADGRRVQTTLEEHRVAPLLVVAGAVLTNGNLIERPDESEGRDQHVA